VFDDWPDRFEWSVGLGRTSLVVLFFLAYLQLLTDIAA